VSHTAPTLSGTVLDAAGKPVARARVYLVRAPGAVPDVAMLTGADGCFALAAARPGAYEVACSTDALGSASASVEVDAGGASVELRLTARQP
jgi:protocatechuate 3,4-dioxygenase beta subunit